MDTIGLLLIKRLGGYLTTFPGKREEKLLPPGLQQMHTFLGKEVAIFFRLC